MLHIVTNNPLQSTKNKCKKTIIIMIINYYDKQQITHQQYKSGMCIYIYIYQMKKLYIYIYIYQMKK